VFKLIFLSFLVLQYVTSFGDAAKAWEPEARTDAWWVQLHQHFLDETKKDASTIQVVFYGDSITQGWNGNSVWQKHYAPLHAVKYGIGGDRTQHLVWRMENGEIDGLHPKVVVLKIGTNNMGDTDENIAHGIKQILDILKMKLPNTKVLLLGILPRGDDNLNKHIRNINSIISHYADGNSVQFLDMYSHFVDEMGHVIPTLYVPDKLHLALPGYEMWAQTMDPLLHKMLM